MSRLSLTRSGNGSQVKSSEDQALESGLAKVDRMIAWGRAGYPLAAANLQHWRGGSGATRTLKPDQFSSERFLIEHLASRHREKFIAGAQRRLSKGELSPTRPASMEWTDSVNAPYLTDLFFAMGGFTVHSAVNVEVVLEDHRYRIRFVRWVTDISDQYDWDPGKATLIPGVGRITDEEMLALERAGYGKTFAIVSEPAVITHPSVVADAWVRA
ncbi:MAG: hypothetical protein U0794_01840 [Isosphaeraceae bacterium]